MSRVYEALQKSQGEKPSASPLVSGGPEAAPGEATAVALAAGVPVGTPTEANWLKVPADRVLHPTPTPEQRLVALAEPNSQGAEMFRVLATRLAHMQNKRRLQKLLITSSVGDEGKSVVSVNLALTLARRHNARTLLIEADLRRPSASNLLTSSPLRGISDWDAGKLSLEDSLYQVSDLPLWILSAGHGMEEPLPLLESDRFAKMLDTISSSFDWVLLDATPMLPMADATSLSRLCDGVLVVVREGFTRRKVLDKALESIEKSKLLGVVFNQASMLNIDYDRYYGGNHSSGKSKKEAKKQPDKEADKVTAATA
ncbi:MAG: CpsD/CapB family tyrosine-protein kinase [Candidatus Korobacteraceae bacterium]